jgi:N-acetylneuraminic acid mutarotase
MNFAPINFGQLCDIKTMHKIKTCLIVSLLFLFSASAGWSNSWQVIGKMPHPVFGGEAIVIDSLIYIFGGWSDSLDQPTNLIQSYNPRTSEWHRVGEMQENRYGFVLDQLDDSSVIACGGVWANTLNISSIEKWNFRSQAVDPGEILQFDPNFSRVWFTGHVFEERLYLFGGIGSPAIADPQILPFIVYYDFDFFNTGVVEDSIYQANFLPYHHSSVLKENKIFIFGGVYNGISNRVITFDLQSHEIEFIGSLNGVRAGSQAVSWKDQIYLIGGYQEIFEGTLGSTEIFDIDMRQSDFGPALNYQRKELMAGVFEDAIYVFGGKNSHNESVPWIERLDLLTSLESVEPQQISEFRLLDNYPNPFNGSTIIPFELSEPMDVQIDVFTISGAKIKTVVHQRYQAGKHTIRWDGTDTQQIPVASGVYIYQLQAGQYRSSKKMILIR